MILILSIILQVLGYTVETIPKTGAPPPRASISAAVYDEMNDEIITIGGDYYQSSIRVPKITGFSLKTQTFRKINSFSDIEPKGLSGHGLYLKSNRKIYEFGYSCEFYSFNLENLGWKIEELEGDPLDERGGFGFTSFIHNSSNFVAIFGGLLDVGYSDDLFL
jgi:hypothetical protein